ncbi:zinc finger protein VAR3, chloroplastic-like isoform X2 [Cucurbita maxima]|uniref:Zinc finger protein VAR3, chloroplastic-like isoform X2 n=1 Tax=Cucurbita maxima TaxID=3661 RepID=A0A6J1KZP8_CUCMA|nr:zinc finger protein VAR3, chloroplastic-like isoform X2 [Cucurbita maxima]
MSPTKFLHFGTAISRATSRSLSPLLFPRRFFINCSSSTTLDSAGDGGVDAPQPHSSLIHHPWPEWISFVDGLKAKGYLIEPPSEDANGDGSGGDAVTPSETDYNDMNVLKDACLSFARDRHDILESLSRDDIQTVMKDGCPNLFRKVVNSAKRLRAYVHLDEGEVCGTCNLRGSCDRAYVIMKETEAARTVDVARILLAYALDPLVLSGGDKALGREHVEVSIRKLLSEISELSEEPIEAAAAVKADTKTPSRKEKPSKLTNDALSKDVEMKRGDWMCSKCKFMNFSRNIHCLKCKSKRPKKMNVEEIGMKKGDWICPQCEFMNFASKKECLRCREHRPKRELSPGEWECPSRNMMCRNCNCERPKQEISAENQERLWESPTER